MARRNGTRLVVAVALLGVAAAAAVVLLEQSGDSERSGENGGTRVGVVGPVHVEVPGAHAGAKPVRNAAQRPDWRPHPGPVPIFRYHAVGEFPAGEPYPELFVAPADFVAQMGWLQAHGYEAVDLRTVERAWFDGGTLPPKPVVLSFDAPDGAIADSVLPDLTRRGWPAVLVLDGEAPIPRRPLVERLLAAGWEIAAAGADPATSRHRLEAALHTRVANFSFPPESGDEPDADPAEAAGYAGATVTGPGFATRTAPYAMPRITVFGLSGVDGFAEAMRSRGEGVGA